MAKFTVALIAAFALFALVSARAYNLEDDPHRLFSFYTNDFGIEFRSMFEEAHRFRVFQENLVTIKKMNAEARAKGVDTTYGINEFAMYSSTEFKNMFLGSEVPKSWKPTKDSNFAPLAGAEALEALPTDFDWREASPPVVTPVKNQKSCGSCWAFSATGNVEGQWALAGNGLVSLSEQSLVDCDHTCNKNRVCNSGCNGGLMDLSFEFIMKSGGIMVTEDYPYEGRDAKCRFDASKVVAKIDNFTFVARDPEQIRAFVFKNGPVAIAADATTWQFYTGGIIEKNCGQRLNHGILLVGWGTKSTSTGDVPYWIIKNSWGQSWGMNGYLLVKREKNLCGINDYVLSSYILKD